MKAEDALRQIFPGLKTEAMNALLQNATMQEHPAGTHLTRQGQVEHAFYVLLSGKAEVLRTQDGKQVSLGFQEPGSAFGELALILDAPRVADVVTTESSTVLEIDRATFDAHIKPDGDALLAVVRLVLGRVLDQQARSLKTSD